MNFTSSRKPYAESKKFITFVYLNRFRDIRDLQTNIRISDAILQQEK